MRTVPGEGLIVCNGTELTLRETLDKGCWTPVEFLGNHDGWQVANVQADGAFDVRLHGEKVGHVAWALMGEHNRLNALAAIAAARHVGARPTTRIGPSFPTGRWRSSKTPEARPADRRWIGATNDVWNLQRRRSHLARRAVAVDGQARRILQARAVGLASGAGARARL